ARREVLDGTERLSSSLPDLEIGSRSPDLVPALLQLRLGQGNGARRFPHCLVDVDQDFGSSHCARVPYHDHGGLDSMPVRIFPFSDRLSSGSVSFLANSSEAAFRVEFPDGKIPPLSAMYWRGVVMWHGEGLEREAPAGPAALPRTSQGPPRGEAIRQWITIEPHDARWMFALDWPVNSPSGATLAPGNYLWSNQPIHKP